VETPRLSSKPLRAAHCCLLFCLLRDVFWASRLHQPLACFNAARPTGNGRDDPVTVTASASGRQVKFDVPAQVKPGATELSLVNNTKEPVE
jgi:hypothetical protein